MIPLHEWEIKLNSIRYEAQNSTCFECGEQSNNWSSVNNGIFLCIKCSGIHRGFGVQISFIRSIEFDSWNEKQIKTLELGGNGRLREFLEFYKIPKDGPMDFKYRTRACQYYRELLKSEVNDTAPPELISREEGLMMIEEADDVRNARLSNQNTLDDGGAPVKKKNAVEQAFDRTATATKEAFQKIKNTDIKLEMVAFGNNVAQKTKQFGNKTADLARESVDKMKEYVEKKKKKKPAKENIPEENNFNEKDESLQIGDQGEPLAEESKPAPKKTKFTDDIKNFGNSVAAKTKDFGEKTANLAKETIEKIKKKKEKPEEEAKREEEPVAEKKEEKPKTNVKSSIGNAFQRFIKSSKEKSEQLSDKIKEQHIGDKISDMSRRFSESVKSIGKK